MFCFAPIDGRRAVFAGEALGNVRHGVRAESLCLKFIRIPPRRRRGGGPHFTSPARLGARCRSYIVFMHAFCLTLAGDWRATQHL